MEISCKNIFQVNNQFLFLSIYLILTSNIEQGFHKNIDGARSLQFVEIILLVDQVVSELFYIYSLVASYD